MSADTLSDAPRRRKWRRLAVELVLYSGLILGVFAWHRRGLVDEGESAPALRLQTLEGAPFDLVELRGKRVLVHFWATWCTVCVMQHGTINGLVDSAGDGAVVISVVADGEDPARVRAHVAEHGVRYPVLLGDRQTLQAWKVSSFPTNYFLDAEGRVSARDVGLATPWTTRWRLGG